MSDSRCPKSPNSRHCYHAYTGPWMSVDPPPVVCCHCGADQRAQHGPFQPGSGGATEAAQDWKTKWKHDYMMWNW